MRLVSALIVLLGPVIVLAYDFYVYRVHGYEATITSVVRSWERKCVWVEFAFVFAVLVLYLHFFRGFPFREE